MAVEQVAGRGRLDALQCEVAEARDAHVKQVFEAKAKLTTREEEVWPLSMRSPK